MFIRVAALSVVGALIGAFAQDGVMVMEPVDLLAEQRGPRIVTARAAHALAKAEFETSDRNQDGVITRDEYRRLRTGAGDAEKIGAAGIDAKFDSIAGRYGKISKRSFMRSVKEDFSRADFDRDGQLIGAEIDRFSTVRRGEGPVR